MTKDNYIVIKVDGIAAIRVLAEKVNQKIEAGYIPVGGITVWHDKLYGKCVMQAMVWKEVGVAR